MKGFIFSLILSLAIFNLSFAAKNPTTKQPNQTTTTQTTTPQLTQQQVVALEGQAKNKLSLNKWAIKLTSQDIHKKTITINDVLTFTDKSVVSEFLSKKGFSGSNYSLRIEPDLSAVFETVQRDSEDNLALWRGELRGDNLFGTLTIRDSKTGAVEVYSFVSTGIAVAQQE